MKLIRVATAAAMAVAALAEAHPAAADADIFGTYTFAADDGEHATWTLAPCADDAPGCVRVSEAGNAKRVPWSGDAHWSVGSLILFVQQPDAILCEDGASAPGMNTYSWDGASLSGSASILTNGACGAKPSVSIPFSLTRLGAAESRPAPAAAPAPAAPAEPSAPPAAPAQPPAAQPAATAPAADNAPAASQPAPLAAESTATGPVVQPSPAPASPPGT